MGFVWVGWALKWYRYPSHTLVLSLQSAMSTTILTAIASLHFVDVLPELATQLNWPDLLNLRTTLDLNECDAEVETAAVFHEDILGHIAAHLDWPSLMALRHCPEPSPHVVQEECRRRIFNELSRFIPKASIPSFFNALRQCKGAIIGPTVRRLLQLNGPVQCSAPQELTIVTYVGYGGVLYGLLSSLGYVSNREVDGDCMPLGSEVASLEYLTRPGSMRSEVSGQHRPGFCTSTHAAYLSRYSLHWHQAGQMSATYC